MKIRIFTKINDDVKFVRNEVFVKELKVQDEFDIKESMSTHLVAYIEDQPVATCRFYIRSKFDDVYLKLYRDYKYLPWGFVIDSLCVLKQYRKRNIAKLLLLETIKQIYDIRKTDKIMVAAPENTVEFFKKFGFKVSKTSIVDKGINKVVMVKISPDYVKDKNDIEYE